MKKKLFLFILGLVIYSAFINAQSLDEAIISAALKISADLPANTTAAIINFRSDSEKLNDYVINELYGAILRNRRIVPVKPDQTQLQSIRGDLPSNITYTINRETAQRIGRLFGAQYLITGSIERAGTEYRINFNAIDTNAELKSYYSVSLNPQNDSQFALLLGISTGNTSATAYKQDEPSINDDVKNWISFNLAFCGIGASYEHMFSSKISLGANINWYVLEGFNYYCVGIDAVFRFYPWGKTFFLGTALGIYFANGTTLSVFSSSELEYNYYYIDNSFVLGITPEIGWKIDVGKKGGLYLQWGISSLIALGENYEDNFGFLGACSWCFFGIGVVF